MVVVVVEATTEIKKEERGRLGIGVEVGEGLLVLAGLERGKYEEPEVGEGDIRDRRGS